ncbi:hypothetical protein QBC37DRAFT_484562 [Rhypophila decipiens]|uniref:Uncharacterized protein n=1 Tax=Rhypophila decipiens TaxID=261697 RepID=A0AAN6Y7I3_9PEZI|nr:hypothetical protein QBC37DRAFT_484562 [Rhypophila decipiens]
MASRPPSIMYNPVGAQCILAPSDSCLYQAAGYTENNPGAQLSACQSLFGFPTVSTLTLPADRVFSTDIATAIYTDIITSTNTLPTDLVTITTRAVVRTALPRVKLRRRGGCRGRISSSSSLGSAVDPSSAFPSSSISSSAASAPAASATASVLPLASDCPNEAAYSSACSCLVLPAVTQSSDPITSVIRQTETTTVTSTSYATAVEVITQTAWADDVVTTTATATEYTDTQTTTTATTTTTTTVQPPTPTEFGIKTNEDEARNLYMSGNGVFYSGLLSPLPGLVTPLKLASPNTQPGNRWSTEWAMYVRAYEAGLYEVIFTTAQNIATLPGVVTPVTCAVEEPTLLVKCKTGDPLSLEKIVACGDKTFMTPVEFTLPSSCSFIEFYAVE